MTEKLIIAHRGASACARENTLDAFKKAIDFGADMIEFDVRRTKNNVFIAYHDEHIQGEMVKELTYEAVEELAGRHGFSIPTVEEVLENTSGKIKLLVELKEEGYEKEVLEVLLKRLKDDDLIIASFNAPSLKIIKDNYPNLKVGLILAGDVSRDVMQRVSTPLRTKRRMEMEADYLILHWKLFGAGFFEKAKINNKLVFVWTVNDERLLLELLNDERISGIITDRPDLAVLLRERIACADSGL
ncbi:MAG TPA: glycerophosphodiester phosphodiesterase [Candidatus Avalokitesvara rifleensis]|uniref:glycerophosphodiester phosphodiesterase n=1 Tax=Candidatus Avalokitesvara rifleensis TaxID=3367620 RepID=UPI004026F359